ncbi:MAG: response regulator [Nitrospiraceae bacterium]|nr:MAG: response regulator [Nitrospiraceae bacterium]
MKKTGKKILVIDDDKKHLISVKEILESEGHYVYTHDQAFGSTALAKTLTPDLILLDVNMPGLSGDGLSKIMRAHSDIRDIPIVFYSSNDEDSLREMVRFHQVKGYICKGDIYGLREKVALYLNP